MAARKRRILSIAQVAALLAVAPAMADEIGGGAPFPIVDPGETRPGARAESCESNIECAWQDLLEQFEAEAER